VSEPLITSCLELKLQCCVSAVHHKNGCDGGKNGCDGCAFSENSTLDLGKVRQDRQNCCNDHTPDANGSCASRIRAVPDFKVRKLLQ
jgi:hypothetical protein